MEKEQKQYDSFIFTHIPKCGGTSFRKYINDAALASGIHENDIYIPGFNGLDNDKNIINLSEKEIKQLQKKPITILANHAYYGVHKDYALSIKNPFYYTILREPVARFISHYNFFYYRNGLDGCKGVSLNDLERQKLVAIAEKLSNIQTHYLANIKLRKAFGLDNILKVAKYNLQHEIQAFGILEKIESSIQRLQKQSPVWLTIDHVFPSKNKNKLKLEVNSDILALIERNNTLDISLYQFASNLFEQRG